MGKTTVVIDEKLMDEVMRSTGLRTKREAIERGLRELLRKTAQQNLRRELGTFDIEIGPEELASMRSER